MKPHRVLDEYLEVYGQEVKITPEAGKKGLLFNRNNLQKKPDFSKLIFF